MSTRPRPHGVVATDREADARAGASCMLIQLGVTDYERAWKMQERIATARAAGETGDTLILLQHPHVFTLGRHGDESHILARGADLLGVGATYYRCDRGGDATYHGPGQIVGYPILDLRPRGSDVRQYVHDLEDVLILTLADSGIEAARADGLPGVWVGGAKIAALGVKVSHWVSRHGFALNVEPDLRFFDLIVPCGLHGRHATSMASVLGKSVPINEVLEPLKRHFSEVFGCRFALDRDDSKWLESPDGTILANAQEVTAR